MLKTIIFLLLFFTSGHLLGLDSITDKLKIEEPEVKVVNFDQLSPYLCPDSDSETTYIVNFFATWCKPCVDELPYFLELHKNYREEGLHFILISLDFPQHLESRLKPFLTENSVTAEVFLLDDPAANDWIPKVDESWSGAIPATIVCRGGKSSFYEKTFHSTDELIELIQPYLNQ
ncbi:MAG: alkyl hydroperoxide reductase [Saprospirales bacterium]|nr:MAG: alkyl hydroperoxide reductase [Saprospirales bacterium]